MVGSRAVWSVLLVAVLVGPSARAAEAPEAGVAGGFNLTHGFGVLPRTLGPAVGLEGWFGAVVAPGVILHADVAAGLLGDFDIKLCGLDGCEDKPSDRTAASRLAAGAGATVYSEGGWFLRASLLREARKQSYREIPDKDLGTVWVVRPAAGVEWWGQDTWGVGMVLNVAIPLVSSTDIPQFAVTWGLSLAWD